MDDPMIRFAGAVFSLFGLLGVGILVGGTIAFLVFRFAGGKWIESRFAQQLANHKHIQDQEIERLKFRINGLFDRASKINTK